MIKSVTPYIGKYKKYTVIASFLTTIGIIANVVPYIFLYQLIVPLTQHELPDIKFVIVHVAAIFICLTLYAVLYSTGLACSHVSAYNTLKNIRISLKAKLEKQPLGNIKEIVLMTYIMQTKMWLIMHNNILHFIYLKYNLV